MMPSKIRCLVSDENSQKLNIFASDFNELIKVIPDKFKLNSDTTFILKDDFDSVFDFDVFEYFRSQGQAVIELKLVKEKMNLISDTSLDSLYNEDEIDSNSTQAPYQTLRNYLSIEFTIFSSLPLESFTLKLRPSMRLNELSDKIIVSKELEKSKKVCFFYASDGQPLSPSFYASQFLMISDVLSDNEKVFVLITNNIYENQIIKKVDYERNFKIIFSDKIRNEDINLTINEKRDKEQEIKDLLGLYLRIPSTSINLEQTSKVSYNFILENKSPNLNLLAYDPVLSQSKDGLIIFRNFLYCLPEHLKNKEDKRLISCIRCIIPFEPLFYSLYNLISKNFLITESEQIALDEGLIFLFSRLNLQYNLRYSNETLFEHTLEFFALLLDLSELRKLIDNELENVEIKNIANPEKVRLPVIVMLTENEEEIYDMFEIEKLKKNDEGIPRMIGKLKQLKVDETLEKIIKRTEGIDRNELIIRKNIKKVSLNCELLFNEGPKIKSLADLELIKKKRYVTQITSYLDLSQNCKRKTLTYNIQGKVVVNLGPKQCSYDVELKDIIFNKISSVSPNSLAAVFDRVQNSTPLKKSEVEEEIFSRIPEEAISILLDTSYSMTRFFMGTEKTRMEVTKDLFNSFINRSLGYNLPQILSLTTFDTTVIKISKFTENSDKFFKYLETVKGNGDTSIFDAISSAIPDLKAIKTKFSNIKTRIICFSDGEDNRSKAKKQKVLEGLIDNEIILDCISLGDECIAMKNLSLCSGGFAFQFSTIKDGFKIFESDAFISLSFRNPYNIVKTISDAEFDLSSFMNFTEIPPPVKQPKQINLKSSNIASTLMTMKIVKPKFPTSSGSLRFKRLNREMALVNKNPHPDIKIFPCETDIQFWNCIIIGPAGTPYAGGTFHIYISFPEEYPYKAPEIRFITKIFHININYSGRICISILNSDYGPEINILKLLQSIYGLLMSPEETDSLETNTANLFRSFRDKYEDTAREWTINFAMKPISEVIQGISEKEFQDNIPANFVCSLTGQIMNEPVTCRTSMLTYERTAIENFISENGFDPITKQPTSLTELFPQIGLQDMINQYRSMNQN